MTIPAKRGQAAMNETGILPYLTGRITHDHWQADFGYEDCTPALCNAHSLREGQWIENPWEQPGAAAMAKLFLEIQQTVASTAEHRPR
jgi:hypothetical protein